MDFWIENTSSTATFWMPTIPILNDLEQSSHARILLFDSVCS
jgi:hypothetical protein